jgi:O-antigen ligase
MLIGNGVTGIRFTEGQFFVVIGEIGLLGVIAFYWLQLKIILVSYKLYNISSDVVSKSLPLAMIAIIVGLTFHAITTNTYIIVRIMEPFWFLAAMVAVLYDLAARDAEPEAIKPAYRLAGRGL